ncbi:hypothetical protein HMPREF3200_01458 [Anaerococcus tetradius]|uniref:Uncharacterized protein n=1 Tax=Anaerococcus tetradius TaxID=33036 RepID=A0A133KCT9_9FIRM|nr:hypothetical protein HMPREF3200_01458 [Anaerococcus tetradius]
MDMFWESTDRHKYRTPYYTFKRIDTGSKKDMEPLQEALNNCCFDDDK